MEWKTKIKRGQPWNQAPQGLPVSRKKSLLPWPRDFPFWDCRFECVWPHLQLWIGLEFIIWFIILNKVSNIEWGDGAHEIACLFADKLIIYIPTRPTRVGDSPKIWVSHTWDWSISFRIGLGLKLRAVSKGWIYVHGESHHMWNIGKTVEITWSIMSWAWFCRSNYGIQIQRSRQFLTPLMRSWLAACAEVAQQSRI